jgi:large subunit ribosomal protein L29
MVAGLQPAELRQLGEEELLTRLRESKEELFNLRFQVATGQLDNNRRLATVRRDIARIYTIMRERELGLSALPTGPTDGPSTPGGSRHGGRDGAAESPAGSDTGSDTESEGAA